MTEPVRVMYVDDEPDIRTIVEFALEDEPGMSLRVCASGAEALETAPGFRPDIVLLDVMMPGMDGPTTLQHLRGMPELSAARFAFVTAKVQPQEVAHFKSLGAAAVIAKPFDPMALADQVWAIRQG
jgi:two-component system OmpR family response regulator